MGVSTPDTKATLLAMKAAAKHFFNMAQARLLQLAEGYAPAVSGNWSPAPATQDAALDQLVARFVAAYPSHYVFKAGKYTTLGGSATEAQTLAGVAATDIVVATIQTRGATPQTLLATAPTTNTITYTFSANPSTDHVVSYQVLRAAP